MVLEWSRLVDEAERGNLSCCMDGVSHRMYDFFELEWKRNICASRNWFCVERLEDLFVNLWLLMH